MLRVDGRTAWTVRKGGGGQHGRLARVQHGRLARVQHGRLARVGAPQVQRWWVVGLVRVPLEEEAAELGVLQRAVGG